MIEDKDFKIGTEEEKFWKDLEDNCDKMLDQCKREIVIQTNLKELCKIKQKEEHGKL